MAELVVEVHIPLTAPDVPSGDYPFPWIDDVMEFLAELDGERDERGEMYDDGEELEGEYLFFICGATEIDLLNLAKEIAGIPGVPDGVYAHVTDSDADMGAGRRVELA